MPPALEPGPAACLGRALLRGRTVFAAFLLLLSVPAATDPLRVTVSIQPVHSLVAGVMQGVGEPRLLVAGRASPHGYQMRPSNAAALYSADLIFWMGVPLETFLQSALANVRPPARVVTLLDTPGLTLLANRESGAWDAGHGADHDHETLKSAAEEQGRDPHAWLSPENAARLVKHISAVLADADPENAGRYAANGTAMVERIDALAMEISSLLAPVRGAPFIMFHDAFQYFESAFGLSAAGALHLEPDRAPGARRLHDLRVAIRERGVRCVFREPQFHAALVDTLTEGTEVKADVLDPLGAAFPPGPDAWFQMMRANAKAMAQCLGKGTTAPE